MSSIGLTPFLSLLLRHSDKLSVVSPFTIYNESNDQRIEYNSLSDVLWPRRVCYSAKDSKLIAYLQPVVALNEQEHPLLFKAFSHYIAHVKQFPVSGALYRIDMGTTSHYMSWIAKLYVIVMSTFMGQHATDPRLMNGNGVPGVIRSLLLSCNFSCGTGKPVFIPRWDTEQEAKRQDALEIALDYNNWRYLRDQLTPSDNEQQQSALFKLVMCDQILNDMDVTKRCSAHRIGLLRYMMNITSRSINSNSSALKHFCDVVDENTSNERYTDFITKLHIHVQSINSYLHGGTRDYSSWSKSKPIAFYEELDGLFHFLPNPHVIQFVMNTASLPKMTTLVIQKLNKNRVIDLLRYNRELHLLPIFESQPDTNLFILVPYLASRFLQYASCILTLFAVNGESCLKAFDVYNPQSQSIECLVSISSRSFAVLERFGATYQPECNTNLFIETVNEAVKAGNPTKDIGSNIALRLFELQLLYLFLTTKPSIPLDSFTPSMRQHSIVLSHIIALANHNEVRKEMDLRRYSPGVAYVVNAWISYTTTLHTGYAPAANLNIVHDLFNRESKLCIEKFIEEKDSKRIADMETMLITKHSIEWSNDYKTNNTAAIPDRVMHQMQQFLMYSADNLIQTGKMMCPRVVALVMSILQHCHWDRRVILHALESVYESGYPAADDRCASTCILNLPVIDRNETDIINPLAISILDGLDEDCKIDFASGPECPLHRNGVVEPKTDRSVTKTKKRKAEEQLTLDLHFED